MVVLEQDVRNSGIEEVFNNIFEMINWLWEDSVCKS